jgi:hypothetical protein
MVPSAEDAIPLHDRLPAPALTVQELPPSVEVCTVPPMTQAAAASPSWEHATSIHDDGEEDRAVHETPASTDKLTGEPLPQM